MTMRYSGNIHGDDYIQVEGDANGIIIEEVNSSIWLPIAQLDDLITLLLDLRGDLHKEGLIKSAQHAKIEEAEAAAYHLGCNDAQGG